MKKLVYLFGTLLLTAVLAACSSEYIYDDPPEQPDSHQMEEPTDSTGNTGDDNPTLSEADSYDTNYEIKYYSEPPYAHIEQGYWYLENKEAKYVRLYPNTKAPYFLLVIPQGEEGKKALEYIANQENSVISEIYEASSLYEERYFVVATKYFESPYLFVSDSYSSSEANNDVLILPLMLIQLNEGYTVTDIENKYKDIMTLNAMKEKEKESIGRISYYYFDCNVNNSYEMLRLCADVFHSEEVLWADADKYGGISYH